MIAAAGMSDDEESDEGFSFGSSLVTDNLKNN